jgi:hypothetical protein
LRFLECGNPAGRGRGTRHKVCEKERTSSNYDIHNSVKIIVFKRWVLKGQYCYMQLKNVGRKLQRQKVLCRKLPEFSFKSFKRPHFTGITNRWLMV